jgi:hypothetical protein
MSEMLTLAVLIISLVALTIVLRLDANQRHEYEFFVAEYKFKFGIEKVYFKPFVVTTQP